MYCSRPCKTNARNAAKQAAVDAAKPDRKCQWCGADIAKTRRADAKFCSADCNEQAHRRTRAYRRRGGTGERPRKQPLVNLAALANRDGCKCALCGKRVDLTLTHPHPMFATVDHVVPISHGGDPLDPANCRVVHLSCNVARRDRGGSEQLRLLG
jgi:5-methylcytosine-specific restriction endonuclease McrA